MNYDMIVKGFMVAAALAIGAASTMLFRMKNDNAIEQIAELYIADETGANVDLSPDEVTVVLTKAR